MAVTHLASGQPLAEQGHHNGGAVGAQGCPSHWVNWVKVMQRKTTKFYLENADIT